MLNPYALFDGLAAAKFFRKRSSGSNLSDQYHGDKKDANEVHLLGWV